MISAAGGHQTERTAPRSPACRVGFLMDQVAGHVTNYRNLRSIADTDPELSPVWWEISSHRADGRLERIHERFMPFVPTYVTGNGRAVFATSAFSLLLLQSA